MFTAVNVDPETLDEFIDPTPQHIVRPFTAVNVDPEMLEEFIDPTL
jgi:hypothetical protein